jgi:hypothetical protein
LIEGAREIIDAAVQRRTSYTEEAVAEALDHPFDRGPGTDLGHHLDVVFESGLIAEQRQEIPSAVQNADDENWPIGRVYLEEDQVPPVTAGPDPFADFRSGDVSQRCSADPDAPIADLLHE